ncbi:MAG: DUF2277 domain-containing protein [Caldilinea sp.]|nr:DUF2277 domain-containing protein [Caldilinea sp.]
MCRNIVPLFNLEPAVTEEEVQAAALQFVRKVSGYRQPSQANQVAFDRAVAEIAGSVRTLLNELVTAQSPRARADMAAKAQARARRRYSS